MSYKKITSIILYVVAGISLLVMLFFYVSPKTVNIDELENRVLELTTGGSMAEQVEAEAPVADSTVTVSTQVEDVEGAVEEATEGTLAEADSAAVAPAEEEMMEETEPVLTEEVDLKDHLTGWELMVYKRTDYALSWAYILLIIAAVAAIVFPMISIVSDVKAIVRLLAILGAVAVMILLSYFAFASDATIEIVGYTGSENSNPSVLKWIGTGLFSTYILFGMAILSILYSEIVKIFK